MTKHIQAVFEASDLLSVADSALFLRDKCPFIRKVLEENGNSLNIPGGREGVNSFPESSLILERRGILFQTYRKNRRCKLRAYKG